MIDINYLHTNVLLKVILNVIQSNFFIRTYMRLETFKFLYIN